MVPLRYVILEIGDQLIRRRENVGAFLYAEKAMIALADFVVVAQNTLTANHIRQSELEPMGRLFYRLGCAPP